MRDRKMGGTGARVTHRDRTHSSLSMGKARHSLQFLVHGNRLGGCSGGIFLLGGTQRGLPVGRSRLCLKPGTHGEGVGVVSRRACG